MLLPQRFYDGFVHGAVYKKRQPWRWRLFGFSMANGASLKWSSLGRATTCTFSQQYCRLSEVAEALPRTL